MKDHEYEVIDEIVQDIKNNYTFNKDGRIINKGEYNDCTVDTVYFVEIIADGADYINISNPKNLDEYEILIEATDAELLYFSPGEGKKYFWLTDKTSYYEGDWIDETQYKGLINSHKLDIAEYEEWEYT